MAISDLCFHNETKKAWFYFRSFAFFFTKRWRNSSNYFFNVCNFKNTIFYLKLFLKNSNSWSLQLQNGSGKVLYNFL